MRQPDARAEESNSEDRAAELLSMLYDLAVELQAHRRGRLHVDLDSSLERDLGIDSLARVELALRLERKMGARLADDALMEAETPRDLLVALTAAGPGELAYGGARAVLEPVATDAAPDDTATLTEVLAYHAETHPDRHHIRLLKPKGEETVSYGELWQGGQAIARGLRDRNLVVGDTIAIMLPTGVEFFHAFFGALLAGCVPVPIYPPMRRSQIEDHLRRQSAILRNAQAKVLITSHEARLFGRAIRAQVETMRTVATPRQLTIPSGPESRPVLSAESLALLQYTSGSTGAPKGVMLGHGNLLANIRGMGDAFAVTSTDVVVSWLPLYHDMGLIGTWLGSLYYACPFVVMSPLAFLARPERWLWAIHRCRGTLSAGPNFAYELCAKKIEDRDIEGLDLSSWRMAGNGAEKVSAATIARFTDRFARYGFRDAAMTPMYGLAEASVALTTPPVARAPLIDHVDRSALALRGVAEPPSAEAPETDVVSCGIPLPGHEVRVVDSGGLELGDRVVGGIQFRGASATRGYFHAPEKTAALFDGDWLDTGDTGYVAAGEIYLTGRIKDLIVRAGRNLYPEEIELGIGELPDVRAGRVAVFAAEDRESGTERLIVVAETRSQDRDRRTELHRRIVDTVIDLSEVPPDDVVLASPGTVLKTANGKVRRAACRRLYEQNRLGRPAPALWRQALGLAMAGIGPQWRRFAASAAALDYAAWFQLVYRGLAPFAWLVIVGAPGLTLRRKLFHHLARFMLRLMRIYPRLSGQENLPSRGACVLAVNHASYLDGLVLAAVLPPRLSFVAKRELVGGLLAGPFLRRLGTAFVERFDPAGGVQDADRLADKLISDQILVVFPEGTFDRRPGLRKFHMGAFIVAAEAGVPVVPVGIAGTRAILRENSLFARRGRITVEIAPAFRPDGTDWPAAIALQRRTRADVLQRCGEPDLAGEPTRI